MNNFRERAACRTVNPAWFELPTKTELQACGNRVQQIPRIRTALWVCQRMCSVINECDRFARSSTDYPMVGVWGGVYVDQKDADKRRTVATQGAAA